MEMTYVEYDKKWNGWLERVREIAAKRSWNEITDHFIKHLREMSSECDPEFCDKKAYSLIDLVAFAIQKMGASRSIIESFAGGFDVESLVERIDAHEKYMADQSVKMAAANAKEEKNRKEVEDRRREYYRTHPNDDDSDDPY